MVDPPVFKNEWDSCPSLMNKRKLPVKRHTSDLLPVHPSVYHSFEDFYYIQFAPDAGDHRYRPAVRFDERRRVVAGELSREGARTEHEGHLVYQNLLGRVPSE